MVFLPLVYLNNNPTQIIKLMNGKESSDSKTPMNTSNDEWYVFKALMWQIKVNL